MEVAGPGPVAGIADDRTSRRYFRYIFDIMIL